MLKFTPLEFETLATGRARAGDHRLKFTPLEFETKPNHDDIQEQYAVKIYSVGV